MTYSRPLRRTILSSGLIFFTDARTFIKTYAPFTLINLSFGLTFAVGYPTLRQIVRCQFNLYAVARHQTDVILTHPAGDMSYYYMAVLEFDPKLRARKCLGDCPGELDNLFTLGHKYNLGILSQRYRGCKVIFFAALRVLAFEVWE